MIMVVIMTSIIGHCIHGAARPLTEVNCIDHYVDADCGGDNDVDVRAATYHPYH